MPTVHPTFRAAVLFVVISALYTTSVFAQKAAPAKDSYPASIAKFHAEKETDLRKPDGWLSVAALGWLKEGHNEVRLDKTGHVNVYPADTKAPAQEMLLFAIDLKGVQTALPYVQNPELQLNGKPVSGTPAKTLPQPVPFNAQSATGKPDIITYKTYTMFLIRRGDKIGLRVKNSDSEARKTFKGMVWYDTDPQYRIEARYTPFAQPKMLQVPTMINIPAAMPSPGRVEFTLNGKTYSLEPVLEAPDSKELFFIFKDLTATHGTYGAGRFLYTELPNNGLRKAGTVTLDFNQAENPPCAVTPYATCPIPPRQNQLQVAIPAGEKFTGHH